MSDSSASRTSSATEPPSREKGLRLFPVFRAFRDVPGALRSDLFAGFTVALLAIPQAMACAMIAGLPVEAAGILCAAAGGLLGPLFAHSRHIQFGPTNATALMTFSAVAAFPMAERPGMLAILILLVGAMLLTGAALRMADLIQYVSRSVITGYLTGASLLIMASQLPDALGIPRDPSAAGSRTFFGIVWQSLSRISSASLPDLAVTVGTVLTWLGLTRYRRTRHLPAFAIALILMAIVAQGMAWRGLKVVRLHTFTLTDLTPTLPDLTSPQTLDHLGSLFGPAFAVAFLCALESSMIGKSLAGRSGDRADLNQDLVGLGISNFGSALLSGMPVSGSLTRSILSVRSGAKTQAASLFCGLFCLAGALLLGNVLSWIPRAALSGLVVCITFSLFQPRNLRICLHATRSDAITVVVTFVSTLLMPLYIAIFVGVATSIVLFLRKAARPMLVEYEFTPEGALTEKEAARRRENPAISIVHVEGELFFGAAELFRTQIQRTATDPSLRIIILRMKNARHLDATSVMALEELVDFLRSHGRDLIISGLSKEVYRVLRNSGMVEIIGKKNLFMGSPRNPNLSTRNALLRAQEILGTSQADVRIFFDPNKSPER